MEGRQITTSTKQIPKAQPLVLNVEDGTSLALDNDRFRTSAWLTAPAREHCLLR